MPDGTQIPESARIEPLILLFIDAEFLAVFVEHEQRLLKLQRRRRTLGHVSFRNIKAPFVDENADHGAPAVGRFKRQ